MVINMVGGGSGGGIQLTSISITSQPTKTSYTVGDLLDLTGVAVTATYSNGMTRDVTSFCTFSPANGTELDTAGTVTVTAIYSESGTSKTATFTVEVEASILPEGYVQISYIESHGTEYIDTGIVPSDSTRTVIDFSVKEWTVWASPFGCENESMSTYYSMQMSDTDRLRFLFAKNYNFEFEPSLNVRYSIDFNNLKDVIVNEELIGKLTTTLTRPSHELVLCAKNRQGIVTSFSKIRIYGCKLYDGSEVVRDFIPAIRLSDGEIGLYDLVSETFFTNQGTGTFGIGAVVDSEFTSAYQQVEYLQSSGTQFLTLTGSGYNTNMTIGVGFTSSASTVLFGADFYPYIISESRDHTRAYIAPTMEWDAYAGNGYGRITAGHSHNSRKDYEFGNNYIKNLRTGSTIATGIAGNISHSDWNIGLFTSVMANGAPVSDFSKYRGKTYYFVIRESNVLRYYLVPCYTKETEVAGMYDLVSRTFFTNDGTGTFTLGSEVNP